LDSTRIAAPPGARPGFLFVAAQRVGPGFPRCNPHVVPARLCVVRSRASNRSTRAAWFARYEEFIVHFARLAEASGMDAPCVDTGLEDTTRREADSRRMEGVG